MYPTLRGSPQSRMTTQVFRGINKRLKTDDGEFAEETNLSSRRFPCLIPRERRGVVREIAATGLGGNHEGLAWTAGGKLYYKGEDTGLAVSDGEKSILTFGAYLLVFPDAVYYNTADPADKGSMNISNESLGDVGYAMSRDDGTDYDMTNIPAQDEPPANPDNGDYWIDTSDEQHILMQYSSYSDAWTQIPTVYTKISATGIGAGLREYDAVTISGAEYAGGSEQLAAQIAALNGSKIVYASGTDYIIVVGLIDQVCTQSAGTVKVERKVPEMSHYCVSQNRLWGCYYGLKNGQAVNEIYASRLGDFRNFSCFMGISTDSYAVSVGQGGAFTGAVNHLGYPVFFKENCLYKVYGNQPSNFQVNDTLLNGVKDGSHKSMAIVNHTLFYLSRDGNVVGYDGALPYSVFDAFAGEAYKDGVAGARGGKYYLSAKRESDNTQHLLVYDTQQQIWHREDDLKLLGAANLDGELYGITETALLSLTGQAGDKEGALSWMAQTGLIGWETPEQKYVSRFNFRVELPAGTTISLYIQYNSAGEWYHQGTWQGMGATGTVMLPVRPRRCDHFRIRIQGKGEVVIYSMDRILEVGGDGHGYI